MLDILKNVARAAGAIVRDGYGRANQIEYKGEVDLVTEVDRRSEAYILERLRAAAPDYAVYAEESGRYGSHDYEWLIDPLDGTTNFAHGVPCFSVSIGLAHRGVMELGVVYDPMRDELFAAEAGRGATLNEAPIRVGAQSDLGRCLLTTGFPYDVRTSPLNNFREWELFYRRSQGVRRPGSAALDCSYVACGRFDGYWEYKTQAYDVAAGVLIAREAGARVSTVAGEPYALDAPSILMANPAIHDQMLAVLAEARR
jgi:myo-inositol-1(or 4)-monophosphatase